MLDDDPALDHDALSWCLRQSHVGYDKFRRQRPDFLVISPPKTGSTWLADNLRCHPQVFVPDIKEVRYFSRYFKWLDLNWYLDRFAPAAGRLKGEASPSYAILPMEKIRLLRGLMPDLKLVFLMREPLARAWSHAKHNHRYQEANFASTTAALETITDDVWRDNFTHDWPLASGDYLGQLRRWLSVFPREQFYLGFFESLVTSPEALLRDIFRFLGVSPDMDFSVFPVMEKILPGPPRELPDSLGPFLKRLLHARTRELAAFLEENLGLQPPPEWQATLQPEVGEGESGPTGLATAFRREWDDGYLNSLLEQEEAFPSSPQLVVHGYRGYNLVYFRCRLYALEDRLGRVCIDELSDTELRHLQNRGSCFLAPTLVEVKEQIDQHLFNQTEARLRIAESLPTDIQQACAQIASLEHSLAQAVTSIQEMEVRLQKAENEVVRLAPLRILAAPLDPRNWSRLWARLRRSAQGL